MKNWYELDIKTEYALRFNPFDLVKNPENWNLRTHLPNKAIVWWYDSEDLFNKDWLEYANNNLQKKITGALITYRFYGYQHLYAHMDNHPKNDPLDPGTNRIPICSAYNWVEEWDDEADMVWYEPWWNEDNEEENLLATQGLIPHPKFRKNDDITYYQEVPINLLTERERHCLKTNCITMVRTDIPHNIQKGKIHRLSYSLRTTNELESSWSEAVKNCSDIIRE